MFPHSQSSAVRRRSQQVPHSLVVHLQLSNSIDICLSFANLDYRFPRCRRSGREAGEEVAEAPQLADSPNSFSFRSSDSSALHSRREPRLGMHYEGGREGSRDLITRRRMYRAPNVRHPPPSPLDTR